MITNETASRNGHVLSVAKAMMAAARTAPKGKGRDNLEIITVSGSDLSVLADEMRKYSEESGLKFFLRDAQNVEVSECVVIIGTSIETFGLNCGYCGFDTCQEKLEFPKVPCGINMTDIGIATGSAAAMAADSRIDNRIMYSVGRAALNLGWLGGSSAALGIALSCTGKSPFFDRTAHKQPEPETGK